MRTAAVAAVLALVALSCEKSATALSPGVSRFCTVSLSGAVTGTYDCHAASVTWSNVDSLGTFTFSVAGSATTPTVTITVQWLGEPTIGTYASSDSAAQALLVVRTSSGQTWQASVGGSNATAGSYALDFTSVVNNLQEQYGNLYATDGALSAHLPAVAASGATNTVLLSATF